MMSRAMSGNTVTGGTEGRQDQGAEAAVAMTQMGNGEIHQVGRTVWVKS